MKKTFIIIASLLVITASSFANAYAPNEKVLKAFNESFESPQDVTWYEYPNYFEVSFVQAGARANVTYDKEGNFLSSTRYYGKDYLPVNILCKLQKKYPEKKIFGVTEVTRNDEVTYYIKLEDDKNWTTIKASGNGGLEVFEKFKKA